MNGEDGFIAFTCGQCHTEIEATPDLIGETTECPACGASVTVPDTRIDDGIERHGPGDADPTAANAQKSRTIRIDLGDL